MTDRTDDAIRADLAIIDARSDLTLGYSSAAAARLAAYVAPLLARAVAAEARAEKAEGENERLRYGMAGRVAEPHRHLITWHRHPHWHGHCDPSKRGYKPCTRFHWHVLWRHTHD